MNIKPMHDRLLVKPLDQHEVKKGGIIIPDTAKERPQEGEVVAVGTGRVTDDGKVVALTVTAGAKILFSKYAGNEIEMDGTQYLIMRESDVLAIID